MQQNESISIVREMMGEFVDLTGISSAKKPRRYLWTEIEKVAPGWSIEISIW